MAVRSMIRRWQMQSGLSLFQVDNPDEIDHPLDLVLTHAPEVLRLELVRMENDPDPIQPGQRGWLIKAHRLMGRLQVEVDWDNGRTLSLVVPPDRFCIIPAHEWGVQECWKFLDDKRGIDLNIVELNGQEINDEDLDSWRRVVLNEMEGSRDTK